MEDVEVGITSGQLTCLFSVSPILLHPNASQEFDLERTFVISSMSDGVDPPVPRYIR
jgi:hypothetical protein